MGRAVLTYKSICEERQRKNENENIWHGGVVNELLCNFPLAVCVKRWLRIQRFSLVHRHKRFDLIHSEALWILLSMSSIFHRMRLSFRRKLRQCRKTQARLGRIVKDFPIKLYVCENFVEIFRLHDLSPYYRSVFDYLCLWTSPIRSKAEGVKTKTSKWPIYRGWKVNCGVWTVVVVTLQAFVT